MAPEQSGPAQTQTAQNTNEERSGQSKRGRKKGSKTQKKPREKKKLYHGYSLSEKMVGPDDLFDSQSLTTESFYFEHHMLSANLPEFISPRSNLFRNVYFVKYPYGMEIHEGSSSIIRRDPSAPSKTMVVPNVHNLLDISGTRFHFEVGRVFMNIYGKVIVKEKRKKLFLGDKVFRNGGTKPKKKDERTKELDDISEKVEKKKQGRGTGKQKDRVKQDESSNIESSESEILAEMSDEVNKKKTEEMTSELEFYIEMIGRILMTEKNHVEEIQEKIFAEKYDMIMILKLLIKKPNVLFKEKLRKRTLDKLIEKREKKKKQKIHLFKTRMDAPWIMNSTGALGRGDWNERNSNIKTKKGRKKKGVSKEKDESKSRNSPAYAGRTLTEVWIDSVYRGYLNEYLSELVVDDDFGVAVKMVAQNVVLNVLRDAITSARSRNDIRRHFLRGDPLTAKEKIRESFNAVPGVLPNMKCVKDWRAKKIRKREEMIRQIEGKAESLRGEIEGDASDKVRGYMELKRLNEESKRRLENITLRGSDMLKAEARAKVRKYEVSEKFFMKLCNPLRRRKMEDTRYGTGHRLPNVPTEKYLTHERLDFSFSDVQTYSITRDDIFHILSGSRLLQRLPTTKKLENERWI